MKLIKVLAVSLLAAPSFMALMAATATPASAQATRTWVSGVGDDVNPCSRTAPCKTFAGAISKTAAGGEINCLDPAGFGAVSIIKSMTIDCHYTEGGALAGGNGITVNMPATTDVTFLRGLDIFGVNPPTNGIRFINNGSLHIEDSVIRRFNAANSRGISVQPSGAAKLYIDNTTIAENGNGATGGGILIQPTGFGGSVRASLTNVRIRNNANDGLRIDTVGNNGGATAVTFDGGDVSGNTANGIVVNSGVGTAVATLMLTNSLVSNNTGTGVLASGSTASARVGNTTIFGNGTGVTPTAPAVVLTYGDNRNDGNSNNGGFTLPAIGKQ